MVLWFQGHKVMVRIRVEATAIWHGLELYECLLDVINVITTF